MQYPAFCSLHPAFVPDPSEVAVGFFGGPSCIFLSTISPNCTCMQFVLVPCFLKGKITHLRVIGSQGAWKEGLGFIRSGGAIMGWLCEHRSLELFSTPATIGTHPPQSLLSDEWYLLCNVDRKENSTGKGADCLLQHPGQFLNGFTRTWVHVLHQ